MPWLRLPLKYLHKLLRAIPWPPVRVHRVRRYQLQANDCSVGAPAFDTPPFKLGPQETHHLAVTNFGVGSLSYSLPGDSRNEARARWWLVRFMRNSPDPRKLRTPEHRRKDVIRKICRARFKISKRAFDELWDFAISETGATAYRAPGRRS
jgi:hypothetical protein